MLDLDRASDRDGLHGAIELLYFAYRSFTDQPDRVLERRGLSRVHHRILYFLGQRPSISVTGLLDVLNVSKQALNAPLRQLIEMGLVIAEPSTLDRRVRLLRLTGAGQKLEAELTAAQLKLLRGAFDRAGPDAQAGWREVMRALAEG